MKRILGMLALTGFMIYTAVYVFVYLARAFQIERPDHLQFVGLYHGDNFSRVLLVAILFLIGEVFLLYLALAAKRPHRLDIRADLGRWLDARAELTGEPRDVIADRAIAHYRTRLEGGPDAGIPSAVTGDQRPDWVD